MVTEVLKSNWYFVYRNTSTMYLYKVTKLYFYCQPRDKLQYTCMYFEW